jgi:hypothetical protein
MATILKLNWDTPIALTWASKMLVVVVVVVVVVDAMTDELNTEEPSTEEPRTEEPRIMDRPDMGTTTMVRLIKDNIPNKANRYTSFRSKFFPMIYDVTFFISFISKSPKLIN